ncbi:SH3 domain-containing protein [Leptospira sp. 201903070]|uniref:SH3 domain-containing protein n=1 Tax=Leptospira ainlahdjerensis TaxID=2810033 RepID=A0ABS2UCV5_9LEPT|nr:SH3 domain-containing protein [Leptospira ainlahdjerensis]MBM9578178.1 SH3 domain-containing protein [Leptospira ainlahdjerensis]
MKELSELFKDKIWKRILNNDSFRLYFVGGSLLFFCFLLFSIYSIRKNSFSEYETKRYGIITTKSGAIIRKEPNTKSDRVDIIRHKGLFYVIGETYDYRKVENLGTNKWYKVKTYGDVEGWIFGNLLELVSEDKALKRRHQDQANFESLLVRLIINEAGNRIETSGLFPYDKIADIRITSPIQPITDFSYNVYVEALMIGTIIGVDKQKVSVRVNLDMYIDYNYLSSSEVKVRGVDILGYEKVEGLNPSDVVNLLSQIL